MERGYLRAHGQRASREYLVRRDALDHALRTALPREISWQLPHHGVVLWLRLPRALDPDAVYGEALRRGVLVSPSPMWSVDERSETGLRLAFCAEPPARLIEGAKRLGKAIRHLLARSTGRATSAPALIEIV
jgi:DNA-binding transcriptional MocR family regulator